MLTPMFAQAPAELSMDNVAWRTLAPFAALFLLLLACAAGGLLAVAREADRTDAARAREQVARSFRASVARVEGAARMNAVNDTAAAAFAGPHPDSAFIAQYFGFSSPDAIGYYGALLLDTDGTPIGGTRAGKPLTAAALVSTAALARPVAGTLPAHGAGTTIAVVRDRSGEAFVVAAANVMPDPAHASPALTLLPRRRVAMLSPVRAQLEEAMRPTLGVEQFRIGSAHNGPDLVAFAVRNGPALAFTWRPRTPGRGAIVRWLPVIGLVVAAATALLAWAVRTSLAATRALERLANEDRLTGLPNRGAFLNELQRRLRSGSVALGLIDLNGFKAINDKHGHIAGDDLLRAVACELSGARGPRDMVARLGGDEFAWLSVSEVEANRLSTELSERLNRPLTAGPLTLRIGAVAGIAVARPGMTARDLIALADARLYHGKAEGRRARGDGGRATTRVSAQAVG